MYLNDLENLNKQFKITKITKILETNNEMEHHFYFLVNARLINKEQTKFKKIKFVIDFDAFDIQEYFEQDFYTTDNINIYKNEIASSVVYSYLKDDIFSNCNDFYNFANNSIKNYNDIAKHY